MESIIGFFTESVGFERVLKLMYATYGRYERVFGAIRLTDPTKEEEEVLSSFFQRDYYNQALIRISLADFERQLLKKFPYANTSLAKLLEVYNNMPALQQKRKKPKHVSTLSAAIAAELLPVFENTTAQEWLLDISRQTRREYRLLADLHYSQPEIAIERMQLVCNAINALPKGSLIPLAEFSETVSNKRDTYNFETPCGQLLLKALALNFEQITPTKTEDCIKLHLQAGLLSYAKISGVIIHGLSKKNTNAFTLENLVNLEDFSTPAKKVLIFEEPVTFNAVCEHLGDRALIAVHSIGGGVSAALMFLLSKLAKKGVSFMFAGNFTFDSLIVADKLHKELGKAFIPWRYTREDYEYAVEAESGGAVLRERKHSSLNNDTLASILSLIRKTGRTASSLPLIEKYLNDIECF